MNRSISLKSIFYFFITVLTSHFVAAQDWNGYTTSSFQDQEKMEAMLLQSMDFPSYREHLKKLTERPHIAGTPANEKVADYMAKVMGEAGMKVDRYPYDIYMSTDGGTSSIDLVTPIRLPLNHNTLWIH